MNNYLVHPDFVNSLTNYFKNVCDIQQYTQTKNSIGEPVKSWSAKYTGISCAVGKDTSEEVKQEDKTVRRSTHRILLKGLYEVDKTMRVKLNEEYFDVLLPQKDSLNVMTTLVCEKVNV